MLKKNIEKIYCDAILCDAFKFQKLSSQFSIYLKLKIY